MQAAHRCEIFHQDRPTFTDNNDVWSWLAENTNLLDNINSYNATGVGWISVEDLEECLKANKKMPKEVRHHFQCDINWAKAYDKGGLYYCIF